MCTALPTQRPSLLKNCAIIVLGTQHILVGDTPVAKASVLVIGKVRAVLLAPDKVCQRTHAVGPALTGTATNTVQGQDAVVKTLANELGRGISSIIAVGGARVDGAAVRIGRWCGRGAADDFGYEVSAKGSQV